MKKTDYKKRINRQNRLRKLISPIVRTGQGLSNLAFNYKNHPDVPEDLKKHLELLQEKWDEEVTKLPLWMRR